MLSRRVLYVFIGIKVFTCSQLTMLLGALERLVFYLLEALQIYELLLYCIFQRALMMMMISALPLGRFVMTPVVIYQCHLNLGSEMRDDDEVVSRCLPQQAIARTTLAQGVCPQIY